MKIAILGTAPSSRLNAPFDNSEWEIWACSPGSMDLPRIDLFFEMHDLARLEKLSQYSLYLRWLKDKKVYLQNTDPRFPHSMAYPILDMRAKFGQFFFTSTIAYMLAMAVDRQPDAVGVWGVDMTANEEYGYQRAGCHYFMQKCLDLGIEFNLPSTSDLGEPAPMYGYCEASPMWRKLDARKRELEGRIASLKQQRIAINTEEATLNGAVEDLEYTIRTWAK